MQRLSFHLRTSAVTVGLCLVGLLSSCGENTTSPETGGTLPPNTPDLIGTWKSIQNRSTFCEVAESNFEVYLQLEQLSEEISGRLLMGSEGKFIDGPVAGQITDAKELIGEGRITNLFGKTSSFDVALSLDESELTGTLTSQAASSCSSNPFEDTDMEDRVVVEVKLQRTNTELPQSLRDPVADDSLEPNNSKVDAAKVKLNYQANLVIQDEDWFNFTLTSEQLVTLSVQTGERDYYSIDAAIYNDEAREIHRFDFYGFSKGREPETVRLSAGTYYLQLSGLVESADHAYNLRLFGSALPDAAHEPNNDVQSATSTELDAETQKLYLKKNDEDWFSFTIDEDQLVAFYMKSEKHTFSRTLFNSELEPYDYLDFIHVGKPSVVFLEAGTYYLKVYRQYENDPEEVYTLSMESLPLPDNTFEPNNSAEQAASVTADFSGEMYLTQGDEDWFTFTLLEDRLVTFNVSNRYYSFDFESTLYNASLELYRSSVYREKTTVSLEAGTYYLRLHDFSHSSQFIEGLNYLLELESQPVPNSG